MLMKWINVEMDIDTTSIVPQVVAQLGRINTDMDIFDKISRRDQSIGRKDRVNHHHPFRSLQASEEGNNGGGMPFSTERRIPTVCRM